ncbi:MAG: PQQ-dependent sugar dehydrogenase [Planctomycetes bacterium]|nr:PQQ-dependent sugar dehydrogenase [Planctomycetota bacterium]
MATCAPAPANARHRRAGAGLTSWNGEILRFTLPNGAIPTDTPFPGSPIWSYGHRNHFGLTVHPITGDLFETENGNLLYDELNRIVRGGNYGWPTVEGPETTPNPAFVDPVAVYQTPTPDPTGTCFYTGTNYPPEYRNTLFFVDFMSSAVCARRPRRHRHDGDRAVPVRRPVPQASTSRWARTAICGCCTPMPATRRRPRSAATCLPANHCRRRTSSKCPASRLAAA